MRKLGNYAYHVTAETCIWLLEGTMLRKCILNEFHTETGPGTTVMRKCILFQSSCRANPIISTISTISLFGLV